MDDPDRSAPEEQAAGGETKQPSNAPTLVGTTVADRYRIETLVGQGAMGAVYRAQHIHMQKAVALKVLHPQMSANPEVVRRFEREAVAAGRIEHPNVAGATDFGRLDDDSFYLVLEFIDGQSLGGLIDKVGALDSDRAARIAIQIAAALAAAHAAGIVHRDLKPENVMLPFSEHDGDIVKVLDFGMAKIQQESESSQTKLTMHGAVYGTPAYMAPEQAAGNEVDHRADLYALGLILHEMLSGSAPFQSDQVMALLVKQMTEQAPRLPSAVPRPLVQLTQRLLKKDPNERVQSADEVVQLLSEYLGLTLQDPRLSAVGLNPSPIRLTRPDVVIGYKDKIHHVVARITPYLSRLGTAALAVHAYLKLPMTIRGKTFPRWLPVLAAGTLLILMTVLSAPEGATLGEDSFFEADGSTKSTEPSGVTVSEIEELLPKFDPALAKVIRAASAGSESAIYALEQRDDDERTVREWMALSRGRLQWRRVKPALEAYKQALEKDASLKSDKQMLGALRYLANKSEHAQAILTFASEELGNRGADFLFDVWAKTSLKTESTLKAYELLMKKSVTKNYSPALAIAMKFRAAATCEERLKLLPEVEIHGDRRSMIRLRKIRDDKQGCGKDKRDDCNPCMRHGDELKNALAAAGMKAAPSFELSNKWRWRE